MLKRVGRYNEECLRIINSKIQKVDQNVYITFIGKVKADVKMIMQNKPEDSGDTPVKSPKDKDREEKQQKLQDEQN